MVLWMNDAETYPPPKTQPASHKHATTTARRTQLTTTQAATTGSTPVATTENKFYFY